MKRLLSLLFNHDNGQWWTLHESDGADPPNERTYMFTFANLLAVIKRKLGKLDETEKIDP